MILVVAVPAASLLGACGGAALGTGAETTAAPAREPLSELTALQRDLEASEARLGAELERREGERPVHRQEKADAAARSDAPQQDEGAAAPAAPAAPAATDDAPTDPRRSACDEACRALTSMRRAADGICSLTQEKHERCAAARLRVEAGTQKIASAGCPCPP